MQTPSDATYDVGHPTPLRAVFLDRDGTLIANKHYLSNPDDIVVLPGVREALARLQTEGVKLFLFTNQSGVGRGLFTMADVEAVNRRMVEMLQLGAELFAGICIAPESPQETPVYRKPSPRFIHEMLLIHSIAASTAWMVGDSPVDWEAGRNAGIQTAAIVLDPSLMMSPGLSVARSAVASPLATSPDAVANRREELGVASYPSLLAWLDSVQKRTNE